MSTTSNNNNGSSSTFRVKYSDYVADITGGSPKTARQSSATTGIGHHINPLHNPYPSRQNQPKQQTGGMPQYGGSSDKCARCSKTVYVAEKKVGAGRSFHSSCFSCYTCKRKLDSTALSEHKGEIYCKACYTKQFGAHGLISGVTMSTEATREDRDSRRSSFGNDLDTPGVTNQQTRQRAFSNDYNIHDESPKKSPQRNDILPEQNSPSKRNNDGVNAMVDTKYQRSPSPSRVYQSNTNNDRHRSTYIEEGDRSKYAYEGEKLSYGSGTAALVDIPVVLNTKRSDSTIDRFEKPTEPTKDNRRSRSPSATSSDSYRRQSSRERQTDFTDDYSRLNINEDNNNRKYSNDNPLNTIASENPLTTRNFHHSSSYETQYKSTTSNSNNFNREQYHAQESSPSTTTYRNRSPSPVTGNVSSSIIRTTSNPYGAGQSRDPTSPSTITYRDRSPSPVTSYVSSSTTRTTSNPYGAGQSRDPSSPYVPQHDYHYTETSSNSNSGNRRSSSPKSNDRTSSGLTDFISKTNLAGNPSSSSGNKNSALGSLVGNYRQQNNPNDNDY